MKLWLQFLTELNKWEKEVASGRMKKQDLSRIRKAKIERPADQFRKGIDIGSDNILKKADSTIKYSKKGNEEPQTTYKFLKTIFKKPGSTVHMPKDKKYGGSYGAYNKINKPDEWKRLEPYIKRHEADEASYSARLMKKYKQAGAINFRNSYIDSDTGKEILNTSVSNHVSPGVLKREKNLTDFTSRMYGDAKKLRKYRGRSGEYEFVKNMTNSYINKFDKAVAKSRDMQLNSIDREFNLLKAKKIKGMISKLKAYASIISKYRKTNPAMVKKTLNIIKI